MLEIFSKYYNYLFLIVVIFYNFFPKKIRAFVLLLVSLLFFYVLSSNLIIYLLITVISVYSSALLISKINEKRKLALKEASTEDKKAIKESFKRRKRLVLFGCILVNVAFLFVFKYLKFFTINTNAILTWLNVDYRFKVLKIIAPIGISFYSLQALSYLLDVYYEKISADKNMIRVALFISFFPQIMEGPIARYEDTAEKLYEGNKITYHNFCFGVQRILWGLFKKMVIADRLNVLVKTVFADYASFSGPIIFLGAAGYTTMLYMEFSGAIDVVVGIGEMFDVKIPENFRQPFFSKNISEFWARWHISLGKWFKDYIYYPISLSKPMKKLTGKARKTLGNHFGPLLSGTIALFAVWSLNGLWHGAGWTFILFGMYHFVLISLGNMTQPFLNNFCIKHNLNRNNVVYRIFQSIKVTILVIFGELIFRASSVRAAMEMFQRMATSFHVKGSELSCLGLDIPDCFVLVIALLIVFIVGVLKERDVHIREEISKKKIGIRWILFYVLIFSIIIFGAYGPGYEPVDPIYADF